jgi:hypothetical protein
MSLLKMSLLEFSKHSSKRNERLLGLHTGRFSEPQML